MSNFNFNDVHHQDSAAAASSSSSSAGRGIVHIEEQAQAQMPDELAAASASDREASSGGEGSGVNFMAQRPSFQVQLPFSAQFADRAPYGSGDVDDGYTYEFETLEQFMEWRNKVEEEDTVEFVKGDSHGSKADPPRFKEHVKLVCARHNRSGRKTYVKKYPERQRKVPSRKLGGEGCPAFISYKTYYNTTIVRAMYHSQHSHEIGLANLPFTRKGRKAAEEQRKKLRGTGLYRANPLNNGIAGSSVAARLMQGSLPPPPNTRASSSQSDVNITIDSGESYIGDSSDFYLQGYGDPGMSGSQHNSSYLDPLPQLPASPFSPTRSSSLHIHDDPYHASQSQHYPSHVVPGAPLQHNSSSANAHFGNLSLTTNNLHAIEPQLPSAGAHTPAHSAVVSPYGPVSPSEVYATPDQLLTPYLQTQHFFDAANATQSLTALAQAAQHASPHSSSNNSHSSGSSRAQSHPHSSPMPTSFPALDPHPSSSQPQLNIDASVVHAQPEVLPLSAVDHSQQHMIPAVDGQSEVHAQTSSSVTSSRLERLVVYAQSIRQHAQMLNFEFNTAVLDRLEASLKALESEMPSGPFQSGDHTQVYATQAATAYTQTQSLLTHEQHSLYAASGSGYNQFLNQVDYTQAAASQGMMMHAGSGATTGHNLDVSNHGLPPHTA